MGIDFSAQLGERTDVIAARADLPLQRMTPARDTLVWWWKAVVGRKVMFVLRSCELTYQKRIFDLVFIELPKYTEYLIYITPREPSTLLIQNTSSRPSDI